ncbi:hypothetical protein PWT90_06865 [Aphanocladium album]|nr:hypothetical protein PWT90_06865 [Aphanocladium album]
MEPARQSHKPACKQQAQVALKFSGQVPNTKKRVMDRKVPRLEYTHCNPSLPIWSKSSRPSTSTSTSTKRWPPASSLYLVTHSLPSAKSRLSFSPQVGPVHFPARASILSHNHRPIRHLHLAVASSIHPSFIVVRDSVFSCRLSYLSPVDDDSDRQRLFIYPTDASCSPSLCPTGFDNLLVPRQATLPRPDVPDTLGFTLGALKLRRSHRLCMTSPSRRL